MSIRKGDISQVNLYKFFGILQGMPMEFINEDLYDDFSLAKSSNGTTFYSRTDIDKILVITIFLTIY